MNHKPREPIYPFPLQTVNITLGIWNTSFLPKMTLPIDLAHRPYNSVHTNVLHCDTQFHYPLDTSISCCLHHFSYYITCTENRKSNTRCKYL